MLCACATGIGSRAGALLARRLGVTCVQRSCQPPALINFPLTLTFTFSPDAFMHQGSFLLFHYYPDVLLEFISFSSVCFGTYVKKSQNPFPEAVNASSSMCRWSALVGVWPWCLLCPRESVGTGSAVGSSLTQITHSGVCVCMCVHMCACTLQLTEQLLCLGLDPLPRALGLGSPCCLFFHVGCKALRSLSSPVGAWPWGTEPSPRGSPPEPGARLPWLTLPLTAHLQEVWWSTPVPAGCWAPRPGCWGTGQGFRGLRRPQSQHGKAESPSNAPCGNICSLNTD